MILKVLSVLCVAGALAIFAYDQLYTNRAQVIGPEVINKRSVDDQINYRLQAVDQKVRMQKLKALGQQDDEYLDGIISQDERNFKVKMLKGIDERVDNTLQDVIEDLTPRNKAESFQKLEEEIQESVDEIRALADYNEAEKKAFIEEFIKAARSKGLRIKVDEDLNVYEY